MTTPLDESPHLRKIVYTVFWVANILLGAAYVFFASYGMQSPPWLHAATAVYLFLCSAVNYTAASNTPNTLTDAAAQAQKGMAAIQNAKNIIAPIASGAIDGTQPENKS